MKWTIGIDIGGTNTKFALVNESGDTTEIHSISTREHNSAADYIDALASHLKKLIKDEGKEVCGIGIGAPNANFFEGSIEYPPNLSWPGITPFRQLLSDHFNDLPIKLTNDANAAALGEMLFGGAKGVENFILITLGTGLGGAIVSNGQLVLGKRGFAAELGHINVNPDGRYCQCGRRGCLETYVSATGIKRTIFKLLADYNKNCAFSATTYNDLTAKMITDAVKDNDFIAKEAFEYTTEIFGRKLADMVTYTEPEAIYILGGLTRADEVLFSPLRKHFEQNLMEIYKGRIKILPSKLDNNKAAVIGAASLIFHYN